MIPRSRPGRAPRFEWWAIGLIALAALAAYGPALSGDFIWNDADYVTRPALRSLHGLWRIWFEVGSTEQYYPLLHSAFWLEHRCWGDAPAGYHALNVLLHVTAASLFALGLRRLSVPGAWFAGALFALHPVCVESVAWISEQKNTLSIVWYLAAALAYLRFDCERQPRTWLLASGFFVLALLTKTTTATLPAALLVVVWWQRGRLGWRTDLRPLLPWFALGAGAGLFSSWVERRFLGATGPEFELSLLQRLLVAGRAPWFYLGKLLWPANLMFIYPRWVVDPHSPAQFIYPIAAAALVAVLWSIRRPVRGPLAAVLLFGGSLFPILGFFNVYAFLYSFVADHFQYLASLGIIALVAAGWGRWASAAAGTDGAPRPWAHLPRIAAALVLGLLGILTWRQCRMYRNVEIFYQTLLERNPACWMACNNLGDVYSREGRIEEAIVKYRQVAELRPDFAEARYNLGNALTKAGRIDEAIGEYGQALRLNPDLPQACFNLGNALTQAGRPAEAIPEFVEALRLHPDFADACNNLGIACYRTGRLAEAIAAYERAVQLDPGFAQARGNLGVALAQSGRLPEAILQFEAAVKLEPESAQARQNLAQALRLAGRPRPDAFAGVAAPAPGPSTDSGPARRSRWNRARPTSVGRL